MLADDRARLAPERDLGAERIGQVGGAPFLPERLGAAVRPVMQDQEVANAFDLEIGLAVVFVAQRVGDRECGEQLHQPRDSGLDHVDAGRFERFEEPARQPERHDVTVPRALAATGDEPQLARIGLRLALDIGEQRRRGCIVGQATAAIDVAVAGAVLERDAPLPPGLARDRPRVGQRRPDIGARHRNGTVARQPVRPIVIARRQFALDQQPAKPGAVEEQVAGDPLARGEHQRRDIAALAIALDTIDAALGALDAAVDGEAAQVSRVQSGVEMKGIGHRRDRLRRQRPAAVHPPGARGELVERIGLERLGKAERARAQPVMLERDQSDVAADIPERMHVAVVGLPPAVERDAELERAAGRAEERILVEAQRLVEQANLRDRRLADADRADLFGFDQPDAVAALQQRPQRRRRHPARGAAAGDDDRGSGGIGHGPSLSRKRAVVTRRQPEGFRGRKRQIRKIPGPRFVIASGAKQSKASWSDSGLPRCARNDG